mmetsp:Transcript_28377/g.66392  ORF Transcript_28377/g.66392 Transcript_28377/m.66392 type:complete len:341 (+) Transcript_28377:74-1096(+)
MASLQSQVVAGCSKRTEFPLIRSKAALVIIDIQKYLSEPKEGSQKDESNHHLYETALPRAIQNIQKLAKAFRRVRDETDGGGCEVIFCYLHSRTNDNRDISLDYKLSGPTLTNIPTFNTPPEQLFLDQLRPDTENGKGDILLPKTSCSVFLSTNLQYLLRNLGAEQVVLTGQLTDQCVESAVRDAADLGFFVTLAHDACAATSQANHDKGLHGAKGFARIVSTQQVLQEIDNGSNSNGERKRRSGDHYNQDYPYACEIEVTFPTPRHAEQTQRVMEVDQEIGDRVRKSFSLCGDDKNVLRISFEATEAKFLRVSVSSCYDFLTVALKVFQEFDHELHTDS